MDLESELVCVISQIVLLLFDDLDSDRGSDSQPPSNFLSLSSQLISLVSSMDLESESESELISLIKKLLSVCNSVSESGPESDIISIVTKLISLISDPDLMEEPELEIRSYCHAVFYLLQLLDSDSELMSLVTQIANLVMMSLTYLKKEAKKTAKQEAEGEMESKLISLITQLMFLGDSITLHEDTFPQFIMSLIVQIISLVCSTDLDMLPKPESELMSLITKSISVFKSIDYFSQPPGQRKLILNISDIYFSHVNSSDSDVDLDYRFMSLVEDTLRVEPASELISIIHQIFYLVISLNPKLGKLISLCPQAQVVFKKERFHVTEKAWRSNERSCLPLNWEKVRLTGGKEATHFYCRGCNGENHKEHEKALAEVTHLLHPKHSLSLVSLMGEKTRECYCCDEDLNNFFYYCFTCDSAMNVACVEKPPVLYRDHPRWHEHTLALFPRQASLTCNLCALADLSSPIYMCPPCDFVVHLRCINLPRIIRISRHLHRISFTPSFDQGDLVCGVCRKKINNDCGGYSCIKDGCSYTAHSRCATQRNVWDGIELEGEPEEVEEDVVEPFVTISDGIIRHFSHQQHHLRLDEDTSRNYNENNQCQACITPIYFGNFYSCMQCDYILHEKCAKLSLKLHHPIHPHQLTLVGGYGGLMEAMEFCSACPWMCIAGFFYECSKVECQFKVHVQCATISEPLVHESHIRPLYLTSKPGEERICSICEKPMSARNETFNCIESDFSLCFGCATLPYKVRYKHDKHILTLSYGKKSSTLTYWCEVCEGKIDPKKRFYICDEYCCVTLHIECLMGEELYMKPGSSEPLVHESHIRPLYLTSKPGEERICSICEKPMSARNETFNCIESDFSLCFGCATLPYKVRYKHDKHILTLSYGKKSSTLTYWCEVCEGKIDPKKRFYICDEYCCVTLHIECLMGEELYMKPGSSWEYYNKKPCVVRNYQHMSRPFCSECKKRCLYPTVFRCGSTYFCSIRCIFYSRYDN